MQDFVWKKNIQQDHLSDAVVLRRDEGREGSLRKFEKTDTYWKFFMYA